ncbi:hypothetical protein QA584_03135 [Anaerocolumna sp. AGMB13025]|uniref:hypothetical protein n=1 Tax=Anaerocolumna sp. AGMB13025 TaxID=3039116 RepID=UPI00241F5E09|nr:hypothetical protein [Anaerocolumna sp. AGMB13025]WFR58072.1 hypothetical protein QA584_03135 [Anaerocolumna sp. AGMB13025]
MIKINNFIKNDEESDSRHICYNLNTSIRIFNHLLEDEDLEEVYIYVANDIQLVSIINHIVNYIDWFATCETVLKTYYENKLGEEVYDAWFNDIEVYRVDITFNNEYDYGATVYCGDRIYLDHALEINFDKNNILDIGLNG